MKYVLVRNIGAANEDISIIEDPISALKSGLYDEDRGHKIFQLGSEVKISLSVAPVSSKRSADFGHLPGTKTESGYNG